MAKMIKIEATKTYANEANAVKAVNKAFGQGDLDGLRYFIMPTADGRFFPVFVGERAIAAGVHFRFNVIG